MNGEVGLVARRHGFMGQEEESPRFKSCLCYP